MSAFSYIGVDVGSATFSAAIPGQRARDFRHNAAGIAELLRWARRFLPGELCIACESSGPYSRKLALLLAEASVPCAIVPPQRVRANAVALGRRGKTDRIDAQVILDYALHARPEPCTMPAAPQQELIQLLAARNSIKTELRRWGNRLHALNQVPHPPAASVKMHQRIIAMLEAELAGLAAPLKELLAEHDELRADYNLLLSIPGIGHEIALELLARSDIIRDRSDKELTAFAGLAPQHRQSGTSVRGKSHIGRGDTKLRTALYMGALSAAIWNAPLKAHYERLRSKGMAKTPAHIAVARKLLLQARSVLRSEEPFVAWRKHPAHGNALAKSIA
jgi:transposase